MLSSRIQISALVLSVVLCALRAEGSEVRIVGNRALPSQRIAEILDLSGGFPPGKGKIDRLLEEYYRLGYLFARIEIESEDGSAGVVTIDEGRRAVIENVSFRGLKRFAGEEALRIMGIGEGEVLDPSGLEESVSALLREYDREGYPFTQVWVESLAVDESLGGVRIDLFVMEGGRKRLGRIRFEGLVKTRPEAAARLAGLTAGEPYSGPELERARSRLLSSGVFSDVSAPRIALSPDGWSVETVLGVRERSRASSASVAFGYADSEGGSSRVLSGMASLDLANISGRLKDLSIYWRNDGAGRNETELRFTDRLFLGRNLRLAAGLSQTGLDTLYTFQSVGIEAGIPLGLPGSKVLVVDLALRADRSVFSSGTLRRYWRMRAGVGSSLEKGSERSPLRIVLDGSVNMARKRMYLRSAASDLVWQFIVDLGGEIDMDVGIARLDLLGRLRSVESSENSISLSEQFYLGGAATLRGYRENQFHGRRVGLLRTELRFGPHAGENLYLFVDGGYVLRVADESSGRETGGLWRAGYGFGLRTGSRMGMIDLSFAVGEKLSIRQTKVHVRLGHSF